LTAARFSLGAKGEDVHLARRLAWLIGLRLVLITVVLVVLTTVYLSEAGGFSGIVALGSVGASYAMAALFAAMLRSGRALSGVAHAQIVADQIAWSAIVYVTGAASSPGTSLYGLTCMSGAIVLGRRGALLAGAIGIALLAAMQVSLWHGALPVPPDQTAAIYDVTAAGGAFPLFTSATGIAVVAALAAYLADRLRTTGGALAVATERAEQAEQLAALGRLAAGLAHEIRNPLGAIQGSIELLRSGGSLRDEDQRLCEIVERETSRLNELVGDMLDLARTRSPVLEQVDLPGVARDVVLLASRSGRGEDVAVVYSGEDRGFVSADAAMLRQLIWNLVRNGVQVSSAGDEVQVEVKRAPTPGTLSLAVVDTGPGIDPDALPRLFDAFYTTRSHGTGVGLAVVKRIIDDHGWRMAVDSAPGRGARFTVTIPEVEEPPQESAPIAT
jgi:two-component system sensor histidine kinase HydH